MSPSEISNALGLSALKNRTWAIFKTSALKGEGLEEAMEWCVPKHALSCHIHGQIILSVFCVPMLYIGPMTILTTMSWAKFYFAKYFCSARVAGLGGNIWLQCIPMQSYTPHKPKIKLNRWSVNVPDLSFLDGGVWGVILNKFLLFL